MPPQNPIPNPNEDRLLASPSEASRRGVSPAKKSGAGPVVGIVIIVVLLMFGALYFWGAHLNARTGQEDQLPLIPAATTTVSTTAR